MAQRRRITVSSHRLLVCPLILSLISLDLGKCCSKSPQPGVPVYKYMDMTVIIILGEHLLQLRHEYFGSKEITDFLWPIIGDGTMVYGVGFSSL